MHVFPGIARIVYFDLPHDGMSGDTQNTKTRNFLRDLFDPAPSLVCPPAPFTDTDGKVLKTFAQSEEQRLTIRCGSTRVTRFRRPSN